MTLAVTLALSSSVAPCHASQMHMADLRAHANLSLDWLDRLLEELEKHRGGSPFSYPESTHPMDAAQTVYTDMGGIDSALDLSQIPEADQLQAAADLFIALGGNMETQDWDSCERERSVLLLDYFLVQGGAFNLF